MPKIRVTPEDLETASKAIAAMSEDYDGIYKRLIEQAETMGDAWSGEDNIEFVNQIKGFCEELDQMVKKLMLASKTLHDQSTYYITQQTSDITEVKKLIN